jgi:acetyl esterase
MALDRDAERVLEMVRLAGGPQYLRGPADVEDWRASPLWLRDVSGVAPALVLTAGNDVLCDEGQAYARRLEQNGIPVQLRHFPDQIHGFLTMSKIVGAAQPALDEVAAALRTAWEAAGDEAATRTYGDPTW